MTDEPAARIAFLARHPSTLRLLESALAEDVGRGDVTSATAFPAGLTATAVVSTEEACVVAGLFLAPLAYELVDPSLGVEVLLGEGAMAGVETPALRIVGNAASILAGERVVLNVLQHLCGV